MFSIFSAVKINSIRLNNTLYETGAVRKASMMAEKPDETKIKTENKHTPGDGIRSMRSTGVFRAVNFELYAKPVSLFWICKG